MTAIPAISLLVCTRNRAAALPRLLASITHAAAQEGAPAIEVVIVDNGDLGDRTYRRQWPMVHANDFIREQGAPCRICATGTAPIVWR